MTPDRLRAIERLFHDARARAPAEREPLLAAACADDAALRADVESLLAAAEHAFMATSRSGPVEAPQQLPPGTVLGPYRIERLVGSGGMGQVYAAVDTRLQRTVAIKVLLPHVTVDPAGSARFHREARLLATLNHPNIAGIYGVEAVDGVDALVLEFVEGRTLAEHIVDLGRIPVPQALGLARQIAAALEAAHERGIVHRDLKPSNIRITPAGVVKVLDFGVAQMTGAELADAPAARTRSGMILGTPAYMSPEQARGHPIDKRTDIWAFGCVLFEMLTGRAVFDGEAAADSLARIIAADPDWTALPQEVPPAIHRLLRRCLQKDADDRMHDAADVRIELDEASSSPGRDRAPRVASAPNAFAALAIALLASGVAALWWRAAGDRSIAAPVAIELGVTFPNNFIPTEGVVISPDGRHLAANVWSNSGNIWMYSFDGSQPAPLAGAENGSFPFWSPDSTNIGFFQGSQIVTMNRTGGATTHVATLGRGPGTGATWNRDNVIVFSDGARLLRVAAAGGSRPTEIPITGVSGVLRGPTFLSDGRHVVFCAEGRAGGSMELASIDGGPVTLLGESLCPGGVAPPDYVLFVRGDSLLAQKLDIRRLALEGEPHVVVPGVNRGAVGPWPTLSISASNTGLLALPAPRGGSSAGQLVWFTREGKFVRAIDPRADGGAAENLNPQISPADDNLVAVNRLDPETGAWHVWVIDSSRRDAATRLTSDAASDVDPVWSPDGRSILYTSERNGTRAFYRQSLSGGAAERVLDVSDLTYPVSSDWTRDGSILFQQLQQSIWRLRPGETAPVRLGVGQPQSYGARLSPDGNWLTYASARGDRFEVFVERFPTGSPRKQISTRGGVHPRWTRGGREIVYWDPPGGVVATELTLSDAEIRNGPTNTLVAQPVLGLIDARSHFDVTRDGEKILMRQAAGPPTPGVRVIVNWRSRLQ